MRPYHPSDGGADPGNEPAAERVAKRSAEIAALVEEIQKNGRTCPKCGGSMAHYRLYGYRCPRGCER